MKNLCLVLIALMAVGCTSSNDKNAKQELWVYTSLYKDTIADLTPRLEKEFPNLKVNWFQAGSEEIAAKVNAEMIAGQTKADVLISSDRFWYEEMAKTDRLHKYFSPAAKTVPTALRNTNDFYSALSLPVMVLSYNNEVVKDSEAPKTFKEMMSEKWMNKFTTGSPLASGTNFTTVAMLTHNYGWEFIKALRKNNTISQGGNSAVLRRIQSKERPVGWVLLENLLRFQDKDKRLKVIYPEDGVVIQANVIAITKKEKSRENAQKFVDWMYSTQGQEAMTRSFMYSPLASFAPPVGAPPLADLQKKAFKWSQEFVDKVVSERQSIKEKFTEIMFE